MGYDFFTKGLILVKFALAQVTNGEKVKKLNFILPGELLFTFYLRLNTKMKSVKNPSFQEIKIISIEKTTMVFIKSDFFPTNFTINTYQLTMNNEQKTRSKK